MLDLELKYHIDKFEDINLDFIDLQHQFYTMDRIKNKKINEIYKSKYTFYEYCIILQKYTYIRKYCEYFITKNSLYSPEKYIEYCKQGNLEAVYYCIFVG